MRASRDKPLGSRSQPPSKPTTSSRPTTTRAGVELSTGRQQSSVAATTNRKLPMASLKTNSLGNVSDDEIMSSTDNKTSTSGSSRNGLQTSRSQTQVSSQTSSGQQPRRADSSTMTQPQPQPQLQQQPQASPSQASSLPLSTPQPQPQNPFSGDSESMDAEGGGAQLEARDGHHWTFNLTRASLIAALASSFQHGYNAGVVNAPAELITDFINKSLSASSSGPGSEPSEAQVQFVFALVVSIYCVGGCLGALLTAPLADKVGRRQGLIYNNMLVFVACPLMALARPLGSWHALVLGRLLVGVNAGLSAGLGPIYLNEIAPPELRASTGSLYQVALVFALLVANLLGLPDLLGNEQLWPVLFALPMLAALVAMNELPKCCESPKFLLLIEGRELQAQQSITWLRESCDIRRELDELRCERERYKVSNGGAANQPPGLALFKQLWRQRNLRRPLEISIVIMLSQQLSGINAVLFYSSSLFRASGLSSRAAVRATLGMFGLNLLVTVSSLALIERAGRKTLHMSGLLGMALACGLLSYFAGHEHASSDSDGPLVVVSVYLYVAMFACGPGSIPWFLMGELFPSNARAIGSSLAVATNWLANFAVSLSFLPLVSALGGHAFLVFGALLMLFYALTYWRLPETKGATSDEICALFDQQELPEGAQGEP